MLLLLMACKGERVVDTACDAQVGLVYGLVSDTDGPVEGAHLQFWQDPNAVVQELTDAEGIFALELQEGTWTMTASPPDQSCSTEARTVVVERCGEHEVLSLIDC